MAVAERERIQPTGEILESRKRRWTRAEFERAETLGLFGADERLELIDGEVYEKLPMNTPHASGLSGVEEALRPLLPPGHYMRIQTSFAAGPDNLPLPDIAIVPGVWRDYTKHHPTTAPLIVEVSDSTLTGDRVTKGSMYANAGLPEYWILNLQERLLEVYRDPIPAPGQPFGYLYGTALRFTEAQSVSPLFAPSASIAIADLLP